MCGVVSREIVGVVHERCAILEAKDGGQRGDIYGADDMTEIEFYTEKSK